MMHEINKRVHVMPDSICGIRIGSMVSPQDKYEVTVKFMEGDADGWQYRTVIFDNKPDHIDHMMEFLNFLTRCAAAYPHGKGGCDGYDHLEGYERFVDSDCDHDMFYEDCLKYEYTQVMNWPLVDWEYITSFESAKVHYYNASGQKFAVNLLDN